MASTSVTHLKSNGHNTLLRFAEQSSRSIHPQIHEIARRGHARGAFEQAVKVKLAESRLSCQVTKAELFGEVFGHPVCYLLNLIARE